MVTRYTSWGRTLKILEVFFCYGRMAEKMGRDKHSPIVRVCDVAFWLDMSHSTYLRRKLQDMVTSGWLEKRGFTSGNSFVTTGYSITPMGWEMANEFVSSREKLL